MIISIPRLDSTTQTIDMTDLKSLVLIGTNGTGKSRLGAYLEGTITDAYRIPTMTNNSISDHIPNQGYTQARSIALYGSTSYNLRRSTRKYGGKLTSVMISNYDSLLNAVFAKDSLDSRDILNRTRESYTNGNNHESDLFDKTLLERINITMNRILPYFNAKSPEGQFFLNKNGLEIKFQEMSDGERKAFYFVSSIYLSESNFIIIDEPEQHMNRDLLNTLWNILAEDFPEKKFCFITHDLDFALSRKKSSIVWVRTYNTNKWDIVEIDKECGIPEQLRFNIVGNREKILFIEGEKNTCEYFLYSSIYNEFKVIPCGDCDNVIRNTIAINDQSSLHNTTAIGIIDRDFRNDTEIESLKEKSVYVLRESEFEGAIANKVIIKAYCNHMGLNYDDVITQVEQAVIDLATSIINQQVILKLAYNVKKLTENPDKNRLDDVLNNAISQLPQMKEDIKNEFQSYVNNRNYDGILLNFNNKGLGKVISSKLGVLSYMNTVSQLLNSGTEEIHNAVKIVFKDNVIN